MERTLESLGWSASLARSLTAEDVALGEPARVMDVQRDRVIVLTPRGEASATVPPGLEAPDATSIAVGDWVLVERATPRLVRVLERDSLIARRAAGGDARTQSIAANIDTLFVVTSCNADFNASRLERYLIVARTGGVPVVIVLTKSDLCTDVDAYRVPARALLTKGDVIAVDATNPEQVSAVLAPWLGAARTVAFVGSSGVGKSTLVNSLLGSTSQLTAGIRENDARGRHTTTSRRLFALPGGAWVIDTPGMRELAIGAATEAVEDVFDDLVALSATCRFRDCGHGGDVGCALVAAVADGRLDARRFESYAKLRREAARALRTDAERRASERRFGRLTRDVVKNKRDRGNR